jgi:NAD(P)-dependent dehydrogenase (short-subunit alcohol dehydrogenase family)
VLLTLALLPALETTATKTGAPTRVTWTGSRTHVYSSLAGKKHDQRLNKEESVLKHLDTDDDQSMFVRYTNSKLLCVLFQLELARHYPPDRVIVNSFCPGQVDTNMTDVLPIYLRIPVNAVKAIRARSPKGCMDCAECGCADGRRDAWTAIGGYGVPRAVGVHQDRGWTACAEDAVERLSTRWLGWSVCILG